MANSTAARSLTLVCSTCHGDGFLRRDLPWGHPDFGKLIPCACRLAQKQTQEQTRLAEASANLLGMERYKDATFGSFNTSVPGVLDAYLAAWEFAADPVGWLILVGCYGTGKTHLAVSIARHRIDAGETVLIQTTPDLLDHLRATFAPDSKVTYDARFAQTKGADLLCLDDYGAQQATDWADEKLFQLLNHRYNRALPTIITANSLNGIDPRILSRMQDASLCQMIIMDRAQDYRPRLRKRK